MKATVACFDVGDVGDLKLMQLNVQCISNKMDILELLLEDCNPHVVSVVEHWCSGESVTSMMFPGYNRLTISAVPRGNMEDLCCTLNLVYRYDVCLCHSFLKKCMWKSVPLKSLLKITVLLY